MTRLSLETKKPENCLCSMDSYTVSNVTRRYRRRKVC